MHVKWMVSGLTSAALMVGAMPAAAQQAADGCWVGKIGAGTQIARAVVVLHRAGTPSTMHVMSRALSSDTLHDVVMRADSVTFAYGVGDRATTVAAVLGADGTLVGGFSRAGTTHPLRMKRVAGTPDPATALMGYWSGTLTSGGAKVLTTGLQFRPAPCGQVYMTLDSPDQGANDLPVTAVSLVGDSLFFELEYLDGAFRGTVSADRTQIAGTWTQSGNALKLELSKDTTR